MSHVSVSVNGLSLVHEDSGGISTATLPDVCLTPPTGAPVPYPNVARSRDLAAGSTFVRADGGRRIAVAGSRFDRSIGGEPGKGGGVGSGVTGREATFLSHSFDVAIEGRGACRLTDKMLHNRGNTIDCAGVQQPPVSHPGRGRVRAPGVAVADAHVAGPRAKHRPRRGVDSNLATIDPVYALSRGFDFIGRYLVSMPNGPGLSPDEAQRILASGLDLFALWEVSQLGPNYRATETGSVTGQYQAGVDDATLANQQIAWCGGKGLPIYFCVDQPVIQKPRPKTSDDVFVWDAEITDTATGKPIRGGQLILAYFRGIHSIIHPHRVGVYGSYTSVKNLFDAGLVTYGWQQIWGGRGKEIDPRAQLRQYAIYPGQRRGTPGNQTIGWPSQWWVDGISGAGAVDLDLAVKDDFGQWPR